MKIKFHFSALILILIFGAAHAGEKNNGPYYSSQLETAATFCGKDGGQDVSCFNRLDDYFEIIYDMNKDDLNKNIDDDAILAVASLLKSDSYGKKYRAARILGAMGGRARNAIPYLRAADVEPKPASNLDDLIDPYPEQKFIELAIQRIQGDH